MRIYIYANLKNSLLCEINQILIIYDKIRELDFFNINIIFLNSDFFKSSYNHFCVK